MLETNLYRVCRMPIGAIEAWDPSEVEPEVLYGPASKDACLIIWGRSLRTGDVFLIACEEEL